LGYSKAVLQAKCCQLLVTGNSIDTEGSPCSCNALATALETATRLIPAPPGFHRCCLA
jgi:hypothetical protein